MPEVLTAPEFKNRAELEKELVELRKPLKKHIRFLLMRFKSPNLETDIDEILQDTLIRALRFLGDYNGESNLYSWLCAIANNAVLDFERKIHSTDFPDRNPNTSQELSPEMPDTKPPFETAILNKDLVEKLLALEPDPERKQMIVLRHLQNATEKEISKRFNISLAAVKGKLNRGLKAMKKNYDEMK